jgi:hypothetical protein
MRLRKPLRDPLDAQGRHRPRNLLPCHPFFTGKQKLVDTAGRVERFRRKFAKSDAGKAEAAAK